MVPSEEIPQWRSNLLEGKDTPSPHLLQDSKHHQWGRLAKQAGQTQEPPSGFISARERQQEECLNSPFWTSLREEKYTGS